MNSGINFNKIQMRNFILIIILIIIAFLGYSFLSKKDGDDFAPEDVNNMSGDTTAVMVPLVTENADDADFGPFGCLAYLKFIPKEVPQTQAVLAATYNWLFSNPSNIDGYYNTVASQTNLNFSSVEIVNGVAKIYLTGFVMGNHCGDATFAAQIEQAALQYPTVSNIEVYVNDQLYNWCAISDADPSEDGCDTTPKLWNSQRIFEI
jgi:spore germination protein GerM